MKSKTGDQSEDHSPWPTTLEDALLLREISHGLCQLKHGDPTARKRVIGDLNRFFGLGETAVPGIECVLSRFIN